MKVLQQRLLWQVTVLINILFAIAIIENGTLIYRSQYNIYVSDCQEELRKVMLSMKSEMEQYDSLTWLLKYWRVHAGEIDTAIPAKSDSARWHTDHIGWLKKEPTDVSVTDAESFSDEKAKLFAEYCYVKLQIEYNRRVDCYWLGSLGCVYKLNDKEIMNYFKGVISEENDLDYLMYLKIPQKYWQPYDDYSADVLGSTYEMKAGNYNVLNRVIEKGKFIYAYDTYEMYGAEYIVMYYPIVSKGHVRAVITASNTTARMKSEFWKKLWHVEGVNLVLHMVIALALLVQLAAICLKPLYDVRTALNNYTKTLDSTRVRQELEKVKSKNEVGQVANDIKELAGTMDGYIEDVIEMTGEKQRISAELDVAKKIQSGFLPKQFPNHDGLSIFASMNPAKEVGGDLYDFFPIGDDRLGLVVADVSGKGVPGSFVMAVARTMIRNSMVAGKFSPAQVFDVVNKGLCEHNPEMMFVTAWIGVLDYESRTLTCANAGHEYPIIRRGDGHFEVFKDEHDLPLGVFDESTYSEYELTMGENDAIFVYSDGLMEAMNIEKEQFGEDRVLAVLNKNPFDSPRFLLNSMGEAVRDFVGEAEQFDDITMLCVKLDDPVQ